MICFKEWTEGQYKHEASYHALAMRVLTFANANVTIGDWAAYIDAVPGKNHDVEFIDILEKRNSSKLPYKIAKILFPSYDEKYEWRN